VDLDLGQLSRIEIGRDGRVVAPFHRAPWANEPGPVAGTEDAPHLARMSGDFFCAPFGLSDVEPAPAHGWTANAPWQLLGSTDIGKGVKATFVLDRRVMGARVLKELTLRDGHPFLYQRHVFEHGSGDISVSNHAMVGLPNGGRLSFSAKRWAETPDTAVEPDPAKGRSILAYPARSADLGAFPLADGGRADLTTYPIGDRHEDFVMLIEAEGSPLGWSAVLRPEEGDVALMLKDPARLPATMLWFSNGGRDYPPWNGRHRHVLGVEDACAYSVHGHRASISPNPLDALGIPTAIRLDPDGAVEVRHVIGAAPVPDGTQQIRDMRMGGDALVVKDQAGTTFALPFDTHFLSARA
jgi:hypothetical protein